MEVEDTSASKSEVDKPPSTPDMSAQDAEAMVDSMLRDSPLPNSERDNEKVPEDGGSDKLPEEGEGDNKQPEETLAGKLVVPYRKKYLFTALNLIK